MSDEDELAAYAEGQAPDEWKVAEGALRNTPRVPNRADIDHHEYAAMTTFRDAARALRDAELALQAAQTEYRDALLALNKAVAPVP